mmetsp:Transcript_67558/g.178177  ORF Transcript_67558/g.178177 Transcript_67558/m.178177 type:complete len:201 (+) Transcript_67558:1473-2075(+)
MLWLPDVFPWPPILRSSCHLLRRSDGTIVCYGTRCDGLVASWWVQTRYSQGCGQSLLQSWSVGSTRAHSWAQGLQYGRRRHRMASLHATMAPTRRARCSLSESANLRLLSRIGTRHWKASAKCVARCTIMVQPTRPALDRTSPAVHGDGGGFTLEERGMSTARSEERARCRHVHLARDAHGALHCGISQVCTCHVPPWSS